jgi:parallel beta-helix repeat protein
MHENLIDNNVTAPEAERSVEIVIWGNRNIVKRNVCAKSNWLGAMVVGGSDNQIFDNVFMNNTSDYSLVITGDRNIVKNNSIQGDETPGVYLSGNENEFFTNMVIVNNYSVLDQTGNNNEIYDNVFKNLLKGFPVGGFGGTGNIWNKDKLPGPNILGGPKIGGNYWLTYTGIDADGDGFGDTPYEITLNGANIDHLPLAPNVTGPLVVNTDGDQSDPDLADSLPDVDLIKPGMQTTLRAAIENANIRPAGGIIPISFNIPGEDVPNIKPASPLPVITRPVSIDGTTQPVKGQVQIYSQISEGEADGLRIEGGGSYIAGLMIYGFPRSAVALVAKGGNVIEKCILGGMDSLHGLLIDQSPGNTLKRTDCQDADSHGVKITGQTSTGNIISDSRLVNNGGCGVSIEDKAARTEIRKNEIGDNGADGIRVDFTGDGETVIIGNTIGAYEGTDIPNKGNGIAIRNAVKNRIGDGTVAGSGNIISANAQNGILLENTADNTVEGNTIGLSADGTKALPNGEHGICIRGAWNNTVGGSAANARNIISGNGKSGVYIETSVGRAGVPAQDNLIQGNTIGPDPAGQAAFPNGECGVFIGNSPSNLIQNNVISGNTTDGVCISGSGAVENIVELNMIGITEGNQPLGNKNNGVRLTQNCSLNTLLNNVISANLFAGVEISSAFSNFIQNNMIGTDKLGKDAMGNQADGIVLQSTAHGNLVGGSTLEQGNIIAANEGNGVSIKLESYENRVSANFIGTDLTGEIPLGNKGAGVFIEDSRANTIGGPERAYRNIISGNAFAGVVIIGSQPSPALGARNNGVSNNLIGTDVFGKAGIGNGTDGNELSAGVLIHQNASENVVEKNVIAATKESGVCIKGLIEQGHQPAGNIVRGNLIGIAEDETKMENQGHGVHIENASGSLIEANTIAFNTGSGIFAASGRGNRFSRNNIIDNWGMGIDLLPGEKATENDPGDPDTGANDLQNFPVLISATASRSGNLSVTGTFNSLPSTRHILEFFVSLGADPTGYGEGEKYVGFKEITTGADGNADFTAELPDAGAESEDVITATATAFLTEDGKTVSNTSEFSKGMTAVGPQILPGDVNGDGEITLADVIAALQVSVGMKDVQAFKEADVDGDGKIAFAEAAYAIGKVLGLRQ